MLDEMDLPLSNPKEELETISKTLLLPLFIPSQFEVRSEDYRDKGIDLHIELKAANKYTNFRFVVQLKATETKKENTDGSVSLQVRTKNINYLLNNPGPAYYILYFKNTDTFYYENLNDFVRVLSEKQIDWQKQETHVLHFFKTLTPAAITAIHKETLEKGKFHRIVNEKLAKHSARTTFSDKLLIDAGLNITDDDQIRKLIESGGPYLIHQARWKDIITLHKKGSQTVASTGMYNLLLGIAYYYSGNMVDALSFLKSAQKMKADLLPEFVNLVEYFLISTKQSLGLSSNNEYKEKMDELQDADMLGLYIKLDKVKAEYYNDLKSSGVDKFDKLINEIQGILSDPKAGTGVKFSAEIDLILLRGSKNNWEYVKNVAQIHAVETIAGPDMALRRNRIKLFMDEYGTWLKEVQRIKDEALKHKNYFFYFNTVLNEIKVVYEMTVYTTVVSIEKKTPQLPLIETEEVQSLLNDLLINLSKGLGFYRQIGHIENEVVALSQRYELEHFLGQYSKAEQTIKEAEALVDTYELTDFKRRLHHVKNKGTIHERFLAWINEINKVSEAEKKEVTAIIQELNKMDAEERKQTIPKTNHLNIHLFPIGFFQFPEKSTEKVYEILGIKDAKLKEHFDHLFTFVIPVANIYHTEVTKKGPREGRLADKGLKSWKNIYRVRKAFYDNKFYRDESIP